MKLVYEKDNKQQFIILLKFYWAVGWRSGVIAGIVCPDIPAVSFFVFIYLLKYASLLNYKTFVVSWDIPIPKNIFSKRFFYPALVFGFLTSGIFLDIERFAQHYLYAIFFISLTYDIFLLHLFILNNWLHFQLIPLGPQDEPQRPE